jgi:hypothetical protein
MLQVVEGKKGGENEAASIAFPNMAAQKGMFAF